MRHARTLAHAPDVSPASARHRVGCRARPRRSTALSSRRHRAIHAARAATARSAAAPAATVSTSACANRSSHARASRGGIAAACRINAAHATGPQDDAPAPEASAPSRTITGSAESFPSFASTTTTSSPSSLLRRARARIPSSSPSRRPPRASTLSRFSPTCLAEASAEGRTSSPTHELVQRPSAPGDVHCAAKTSAASAHAAARAGSSASAASPLPPSISAADASGCAAIARSSVAARRRSASGHARVPPSARSRRQVVVTASPSLACCGPRFCFCFFAWSPRTPARGEAREASPSSALSTSGRRSRARCASVVAGARSAPPRVRHALSACARVTGRCPSSRFASASPASALPRNVTTACSSPLGDMSCGHRRSSSRKICAVRFAASPSRLAPASSASSLAAAASAAASRSLYRSTSSS